MRGPVKNVLHLCFLRHSLAFTLPSRSSNDDSNIPDCKKKRDRRFIPVSWLGVIVTLFLSQFSSDIWSGGWLFEPLIDLVVVVVHIHSLARIWRRDDDERFIGIDEGKRVFSLQHSSIHRSLNWWLSGLKRRMNDDDAYIHTYGFGVGGKNRERETERDL